MALALSLENAALDEVLASDGTGPFVKDSGSAKLLEQGTFFISLLMIQIKLC